MSKITRLVGPPLEIGMLDKILASVNAVAMSPSSSMRSKVPVGKKGNTRVNEDTNMRGKAYIIESCSKITAGELNDARKATCWPRIPCALGTKRLGNPSANVLPHHTRSIVIQQYTLKSRTTHSILPFLLTQLSFSSQD